MARDIRYARTEDGVSIAYTVSGDGRPIVCMPSMPFACLDASSEPTIISSVDGSGAMLVEYDGRGTGLSDITRFDYSVEHLALDLDAVVRALSLERFDLVASMSITAVAMYYAARHTTSVGKLALILAAARSSHFWGQGRMQAYKALREADWETYKDVVSAIMPGVPGGLGWLRRLDFDGVTEQSVRAFMDASMDLNVTDILADVRAETLIINLSNPEVLPPEAGREIASAVPNARLVTWRVGQGPGDPLVFISEFLGVSVSDVPVFQPRRMDGAGFRTIMFTDLEGSTTLTQRIGDEPAQAVLRSHDAIVRSALAANSGREIKHTGDGIMAAFDAPSAAIECAINIQRKVTTENLAARVRIGINAGEPVAEGDDLFGTAVQLARRICDHGEGGDILVANVVRELAAGKGFAFADRGEAVLKGFEDATRVYAVSWSP